MGALSAKVRSGNIVVTTLIYVFLVIVAAVVLYPVLFTISSAFNDADSLAATSIIPFTKVEYSPDYVLDSNSQKITVEDGVASSIEDGDYILSYSTHKLIPFDVESVTPLQMGTLVNVNSIKNENADIKSSRLLLNDRDSLADYEKPYSLVVSLQGGIWSVPENTLLYRKDGSLINNSAVLVDSANGTKTGALFDVSAETSDSTVVESEEADEVVEEGSVALEVPYVAVVISGQGNYAIRSSTGEEIPLVNDQLFLNEEGKYVKYISRSFGNSYFEDVFAETPIDKYTYKFNKENIGRTSAFSTLDIAISENEYAIFEGYVLDGSMTKVCEGSFISFADGKVDPSNGGVNLEIVDDGLFNTYVTVGGLQLVSDESSYLNYVGITKTYSLFKTNHYKKTNVNLDYDPLTMEEGKLAYIDDGDYSLVYGGEVTLMETEEDMFDAVSDVEEGTVAFIRVIEGVPYELTVTPDLENETVSVYQAKYPVKSLDIARSATSGTVQKPGKLVFPQDGYVYFSEVMDGVRQFRRLFHDTEYLTWYKNTLKIAVLNTLFTLVLCVTSAYVFSRFNFKGKKPMMAGMVVLQMFPSFIGMIATYVILWRINALDTHWGLVLVYATGNIPYNTWMLKGYFDTVSKSIEEAALVDGASRLTTYVRIILPMVKPMIAFLALTSFTGPWMDFIFPRLILRSQDKMTLAVGLFDMINGRAATNFTMFAAGALLVAVPFSLLFMCGQNFMVQTMASGAVKE